MERIRIRAAVPADATRIAGYHDRCVRTTFADELLAGSIVAPDLGDTEAQLRCWFEPGSDLDAWVADLDGTAVGHVAVSGHRLVHLFVDPDHHGVGLGSRLLSIGERALAEGGRAHLELHVRVENVRAIAFYERAGWAATNEVIRTVEHGIEYDERVMTKETL